MEPTLAELLMQNRPGAGAMSTDPMMAAGAAAVPGAGAATAGGASPLVGQGQAALGLQAMKNIQGMLPTAAPVVQPGGAGIAPRGQQVQMAKPHEAAQGIDPRIQMGLAQLLFGGR